MGKASFRDDGPQRRSLANLANAVHNGPQRYRTQRGWIVQPRRKSTILDGGVSAMNLPISSAKFCATAAKLRPSPPNSSVRRLRLIILVLLAALLLVACRDSDSASSETAESPAAADTATTEPPPEPNRPPPPYQNLNRPPPPYQNLNRPPPPYQNLSPRPPPLRLHRRKRQRRWKRSPPAARPL